MKVPECSSQLSDPLVWAHSLMVAIRRLLCPASPIPSSVSSQRKATPSRSGSHGHVQGFWERRCLSFQVLCGEMAPSMKKSCRRQVSGCGLGHLTIGKGEPLCSCGMCGQGKLPAVACSLVLFAITPTLQVRKLSLQVRESKGLAQGHTDAKGGTGARPWFSTSLQPALIEAIVQFIPFC